MDLATALEEMAEWLRGVGYGVDWFTQGNHQIPTFLRLPLARAWWAQTQADAAAGGPPMNDESIEDYYAMLAEELHWT